MSQRLPFAVLLLSVAGCNHQVGVDHLTSGNTDFSNQLTSHLRDVFAVSDREVYLVGDQGTVARFDGTKLERVAVDGLSETDQLLEVAAADSGDVVVYGGQALEQPLLLTLHGGKWTALDGPPGVTDFRVEGMMSSLHFGFENPKRVVLAGGRDSGSAGGEGYATSYAGGTFNQVALPSTYPLFEGVTGIGATLYLQHLQGMLVLDPAGATDAAGVPSQVQTDLVSMLSGRDRYMFGFHLDGRFFTSLNGDWSSTQTPAVNMEAVDGRAINDLYAVGDAGAFFHFDGASWSPIDSGTSERLYALHVLPNGHVYVVGENGTFFRYVP